jgi:hypothetical protein
VQVFERASARNQTGDHHEPRIGDRRSVRRLGARTIIIDVIAASSSRAGRTPRGRRGRAVASTLQAEIAAIVANIRRRRAVHGRDRARQASAGDDGSDEYGEQEAPGADLGSTARSR